MRILVRLEGMSPQEISLVSEPAASSRPDHWPKRPDHQPKTDATAPETKRREEAQVLSG